MKRGARIGAITFLVVVLAVAAASVALWRVPDRRPASLPSTPPAQRPPPDDAAIARLDEIALYRPLLRAKAVRSGRIDDQGVLHVEVDLRAVVEPRLASMGFPGASSLFPASATGAITVSSESWSLAGPAPLLDILDRTPEGASATPLLDAIPGEPSALVRVRLTPSRLADPSLGGDALSSWRDRVSFAEKLLGRPLRAELAEDLAGPAVFALYEGVEPTEAEALVAAELRRSDRLVSLLDMLFSLGALTERATVSRYRGVSTGSFVASTGGAGLALAVDGSVLFVATTRARLESAIDARRVMAHPRATLAEAVEPGASWSAVSASAFVRHGWASLAHSTIGPAEGTIAITTAALWPVGATGWRLDGTGPAPALTADPVLPFFLSVFGRRQRGTD